MSSHVFQAGKFVQRSGFKSFSPNAINTSFKWNDPKIDVLLEEARGKVGELNAYSVLVPDVDFFITMHITKEATQSSKIEGTQTGFDDALLPKEEIDPEKRDDWAEIQNYIRAMNDSLIKLNKIPLSMRLLKQAHKTLLTGVRGKHKLPGQIRTSQNWIGGATLSDAVFIPPTHEDVPELLGDLEKFWHNRNIDVPDLVRAAITHYQFETIHPFLDGNGRIGRLLITLYMVDKGLLKKPTLYISDFFEKHKEKYYSSLMKVRTENNIEEWIKFFLVGVSETATKSVETFNSIIKLKQKYESEILQLGRRAKNARVLLDILWSQPVITIKQVEKHLGISTPSANTLVSELEKMKILEEATGFKRNRIFLMKRYIELFNT